MELIKKIDDLREKLCEERRSGKEIGLVPTMGYLHDGHLALVKKAVSNNDIVVISIFVNPTQFGPDEDYDQYPRDLKKDSQLAQKEGVDYIFAPDVKEMYPQDYKTFVQVKEITNKLCGASRKGHFRGVTTVVSKLFNIVQPDRAYFGQKDYQQYVVIKRMVADLNFPVKIKKVPIIREEDGLAMSSRNKYLSKEGRKAATVLYKSLKKARQIIEKGNRKASLVKEHIRDIINNEDLTKIEYIEILNPSTLETVDKICEEVVIALAVYVEETRLIDNIYIKVGDKNDENSP